MRSIDSITDKELETIYESVIRQLNAGHSRLSIIANIQDRQINLNSANIILENASKRISRNTIRHDEKININRLILSFLYGSIYASIGGAFWAFITIISGYEYVFLVLIIGLLAGVGTYKTSNGIITNALRIIAVLSSIIGIMVGRIIIFANMFAPDTGFSVSSFSYYLFSDSNILNILWIIMAIGMSAFKIPRDYNRTKRVQ